MKTAMIARFFLCVALAATATCQERATPARTPVLFAQPSVLNARGEGPLNLLITDPEGRRAGFDAAQNAVVSEVPSDPFYCCQGSPSQYIDVGELIVGTYTLTGKAFRSGAFTMSLEHVSEHMVILSKQETKGTVEAGQVVSLKVVVPLVVRVDLKPDESENIVGGKNDAVIPVAVFSEANFDAPALIDPRTITFGRHGDEKSLVGTPQAKDIDRDGHPDLLCHVRMDRTGLKQSDGEANLRAKLRDGKEIIGYDIVSWR